MSGRITIDNLSDSLKEVIEQSGLTEEQVIQLIETNISGDLDLLNTSDKSSLVAAINELFQSANNGKQLIASAIGEPLDSNDTFNAMSNDINSLLSTFKTNMMNNGITVESGDKFKSLIDKIATLADNEGKGIQYATGQGTPTSTRPFIDVIGGSLNLYCLQVNNLTFKPSIILLGYSDPTYGDYTTFYSEELASDRVTLVNTKRDNTTLGTLDNIVKSSSCTINSTGFILPVSMARNYTWIAIGVGEEDTSLRDSLADILGDKGVDVTEEDDMASLITKVEGIEQGSRYPKWYTHPGNVISTDKQISVQCYNSSAIACGTNIYCMGGYSGPYGSYHTMNDCYNTVDNTITSKTPLPGRRAGMALSSIDKLIYCMGGRDDAGNISVNHIYDTELDAFSDGTSTPFVGSTRNVSAVYNRKIHFITSGNHSCYDPDLNAWTTKNPVTFSVTYAVVAGVIKDKIYILPHYYPTEYVREYDPALNTWTNKATVSVSGTYGAGGVIDDRLYYAAAYEAYTNINYYDPTTDSFSTPMNFSSRQTSRAAATLNGCLYLFGGCRNNDSSYRSSVIDIYVR